MIANTSGPQTVDHSNITFGSGSEGMHWDGLGSFDLSCVNIFGNDDGDWVGAISDLQQANGNLNLDPQFCGDANPVSPFSIAGSSPCAAANNPGCGLIGALPVGCGETSGAEEPPLTSDFKWHGCFPNPFNPATTLSFELNVDSDVTLMIFDVHGRLVRSLTAGYYLAGEHRIMWHGVDNQGREVGSGVFFAQLKGGQRSVVQKMILLR